jgi:hypothetical protein
MSGSGFKLFLTGIISLTLFTGIHLLMQEENIYQKTLGKISSNYQRIENDVILNVKQAFSGLDDERFYNWDADIYYCISEHGYSTDSPCYLHVRGAFFPLFPLLWKWSGLNAIGISLLNYFIFISCLAYLTVRILKLPQDQLLFVYGIMVSLPAIVIYMIPYTEALFLLTMVLAYAGHSGKRYVLYFAACLAMATLRPATVFIALSFIAVEFLCYLHSGNFKCFIKPVIKRIAPFATGFLIAIGIQYLSSRSLSTMVDSQEYWKGGIRAIEQVTDWSREGFGLNAFALIFVAIPAVLFLIYTVSRKSVFRSVFNKTVPDPENADKYFFLVSIFYLSGIFLFKLLCGGGNLHSFFRLTMTSPAFYIGLLFSLNYFSLNRTRLNIPLFLVPLILLIIFLSLIQYGGSRFEFPFLGMYLSIAGFALLFFKDSIGKRMRWFIAGLIIFGSLVWNTYLLNIFLNEAWIFT